MCNIGKNGSAIKTEQTAGEKGRVFTNWLSPRSVGLLVGICWTKSQSTRHSLGLGSHGHKLLVHNLARGVD